MRPPPRAVEPARPIRAASTMPTKRKMTLLSHIVTAGSATRRSAMLSPAMRPTQYTKKIVVEATVYAGSVATATGEVVAVRMRENFGN